MSKKIRLFFISVLISLSSIALAAPDLSPSLELSGKITKFTDKSLGVYRISEAEFLAMKQTSFITQTAWTRASKFSGVKLDEILALAGVSNGEVELVALDGYRTTIPVAEIKRYGPILARTIDDKPLETKNWGPYWVIYPIDSNPKELSTQLIKSRFIWQVKQLIFK